jgi:hypothetical protein
MYGIGPNYINQALRFLKLKKCIKIKIGRTWLKSILENHSIVLKNQNQGPRLSFKKKNLGTLV